MARVSALLLGTAGLLLASDQALAQVFDVTNGNASGPGSLPQAISAANASGAAATIQIDVPSISLGRQLALANTAQLVSTVGGSQITLSPSTGLASLVSFTTQPIAFTIGKGITLSTSDASGIYVNTIGSTVTINGTVSTGGTNDGVSTAGSANIVVGSTGTIHSTGTAIRELGGIGGNVQIIIAPGGSVISTAQPAIVIQDGTYNIVDNGFLTSPGAFSAVSGVGTLTGTGTIGNLSIDGTFQPGSGTAGSSMMVAGTLAFSSTSIYAVNINPATASLANVTGTAALGGATVRATYASGSYISKQYTILTAASGVSGTFNPAVVNTNLPSGFKTTLSYDANDAYLNLALSFTPLPSGPIDGLSGNQQSVAIALIMSSTRPAALRWCSER